MQTSVAVRMLPGLNKKLIFYFRVERQTVNARSVSGFETDLRGPLKAGNTLFTQIMECILKASFFRVMAGDAGGGRFTTAEHFEASFFALLDPPSDFRTKLT